MLMMLCDEKEDETKYSQEEKPPDNNSSEKGTQGVEHHLSLNELKGSNNTNTLRFQGEVGNITLQILIDGGSSDNFLQPRIAQFLKLPIEPAP